MHQLLGVALHTFDHQALITKQARPHAYASLFIDSILFGENCCDRMLLQGSMNEFNNLLHLAGLLH